MLNVQLKFLIDEMKEGLYLTDAQRRITYWNKAAEKLTGYSASEVVGSRCSENILIHVNCFGECICMGNCPLANTIQDGQTREAEVYLHHKNGHRVPVHVRTLQLTNEKGEVIGGAELFSDASHEEAVEARIKELEELVLIDPLTKLSNRRHLELELERFLTEKKRHKLSFGILFLDLDHFKGINDKHGHSAGDLVLQTVGNTLKSCARPYDTFGRWGGEEFVGLIRNIDAENLVRLGERIRGLVASTRIHIPTGETIQVTTSIGATLALPDDTSDSIIARADHCLYSSKDCGRNCLTIN